MKANTHRNHLFGRKVSCLALVVSAGLVLAGCVTPEPMVFGVPQSQWDGLNDEQQAQVIDGYNQKQQQQTENEPWLQAIGLAGDVLAASGCHGKSKSKSSSTTTSHTHETPNGYQTNSKTKSTGFSFSTPC